MHPVFFLRRRAPWTLACSLIVLLIASLPRQAGAVGGDWSATAGGSWGTATNWSTNPTIPGSAAGDVININSNLGAAAIITLDGARTMGDLNIGDSATSFFGFTINTGSGGTLVMDATTAPASIDFLNAGTSGAANTIGAGLTLNDNTVIRSNNNFAQTFGGIINDGAASYALTFNNDVNGTSNAAASNQGQFVLSNVNTYDGGTSISDVRVLGSNAAAFGAGAVSITGAGQAYLTTGTVANTFNLNSTGWVESAGNLGALRIEGATLSGTVNLQRNSEIGVNSGTGTISGAITGTFNLTKTRGALLILSGASTYAGITIVNDGQLRIQSTGALGNSPAVIVENPANPASADTNTLQLAGGLTFGAGKTLFLRNNSTSNIGNARTQLENQAGNNTWAGNIVLEGGTNQTITSSANTLTIAGAVSQGATPSTSLFIRGSSNGVLTGSLNIGSGQLYKTDGGAWTFSTAGNTHGNLVIGNGTLVANATNAFSPSSTFTMGEGNTNNTRLTINSGFTQTFAAITTASTSGGAHTIDGAGALDAGAGGLNLSVFNGAAASDLTITANITGSGGITKLEAGNLVLNNTTSGPVAVAAGTLTGTATMGGLSMAGGTAMVPGTATAVGTIATSTLAFGAGATSLAVNVGALGTDLVTVTNPNGLTQAGTTTIGVTSNGGFANAATFYPLISYTGTSPGTTGFIPGTLPGRVTGSVTDTGSAIGLTLSNDRIVWTGAALNGNWDVNTTANWKKSSDGLATNFLSQDDVIFNDDGIAQNNLTLTGTINPIRVEFGQTTGNTYTLASGTLAGDGPMPLLVNGGGTVVLKNSNTYTGPTTVTGNSTLEVDHTTGTLTATSGVQVDAGSTLKLTRENGVDFTFNRSISGAGTVLIDPNKAGTAGSRGVTISGTNTGFTGTWDLDPSGTYLTNGTMRAAVTNQSNLGSANVLVRDGAQLWANAGTTFSNNLTLTGAGFQEGAGGTPATTATGADGSSPVVPALAYGGIGAVRMENNGVLAGAITLSGDTKIMAYGATGTISGNITNVASTDDFVFGGGQAGSNLFLTGDNSALERIWVNGGGTAGTNQLLVGNNTATGTLGSGDVILYQDAAAATLRFQRSDGYTLVPGQKIIAAHDGTATNLAKSIVVINTPGAGVTLNGGTIDLSDGTNGGSLYVGGFSGGNGVNGSILNIDAGATVQAEKLFVGDQSGVAGTVNQTGGAVSIINQVRFGHYSNNTSTFNLSGGSLTITGTPGAEPSAGGESNGVLYLGIDGTGVLNHSGGTISTPAVVLDNRGATAGTDQYNLSGTGILELRTAYGLVGRNTDATITLAGGTIRNTGTGVDVAINATNISATASTTTTLDTGGASNKFTLASSIGGTGTITTINGGTIELEPDSNTTKTSVSTGTGTQTISAILAGTSAFTKLGTGTTTLSGANTYSGATTVSAGRLNLTGSIANSALTVGNSATLGGEGTAASISFGSGGTTNLFIDGSTAGALTSTGTLTVNGTVSVDFSAAPTTSTVLVLNHGGTSATSGNFSLVNGSNYRSQSFNVGATDVTLDLGSKSLVWDGSTATWEIAGTENDWNGGANDNFYTADAVTFDETYVTANQTITMSAGLLPSSITVNNPTYNYAFTGGGIGGTTGITKAGAANVDLGGANTFTGAVGITGGTVKITTAGALGATSGGTSVAGGGTLDIGGGFAANALNLGAEVVTISGAGVGGNGVIINSSANQQQNAFKFVTLADHATIGGAGRYDIRGADAVLDLAGKKLTKVGSNTVYATVDGTITGGDMEVTGGTLGIWNGTANGTGTFTASTGGILEFSNTAAGKFYRPITLNGGTLFTGSGATTEGGVTLASATSVINNTADLVVNGVVSETGGAQRLVKTGGGTLVLTNGSNSFSDGVDVSTGILRAASDAALGAVPGSADADNLILRSGGRIQGGSAGAGVDLTINANRGVTLASGDGGFHVWTGFTMNYGGAITGPGNLTKTDGGTLNFTGTSNHAGTTVVNGGTWSLSGATISSTSQLRGLNGTLNVGSGSSITTPRVTTADGSGAQGTINLSGGTINVTGTDNSDATSASLLLGHWGASGASSTVNITAGLLNAAATEMKMGWDSANVAVNQSGGEVRILGLDLNSGRSNFATYNLTGGTLNIGASGIGANASKMVNLGGGTLGAFANWSTSQVMQLTGAGGNLTVNTLDSVDGTTARTITTTGTLSGPGGLVKTGAGTLLFNGPAQYTGSTTVNGGTLAVDGNQVNNRLSNNHQVTVNNSGTFQVNGVNALPGTTNGVDVTVNSGGILNVVTGGSAAIGAGGQSHAHLRNLRLNGGTVNLSYSGGGTAYNGESFQLNGQVTVGGTSVSTIQYSTGGDSTNSGLALSGTGTFNVADATGSAATDLLVTAEIEDNDTAGDVLAKTGAGTIELTAANTYTGGTELTGGTLRVNALSGIGTGYLAVKTGATFDYRGAGAETTTRTLWLDNGASTIHIQEPSAELTWNPGAGTRSQAFTKTGAGSLVMGGDFSGAATVAVNGGKLTLNAASTYTGSTAVTAGTLLVNNTTGSGTGTGSVSVASGATLGGTGAIAGTVNVTGILSPGTSIESLDTGALTLNDGSTFLYELNTSTTAADLVNVSGNLDLNGTVTLSLADLGSNAVLPLDTKFTLFSYSGAWTPGDVFSGYADGSTFTMFSNIWEINYDDTTAGTNGGAFSNFVTLKVIPEPAAAALALLGSLVLFRRRRA